MQIFYFDFYQTTDPSLYVSLLSRRSLAVVVDPLHRSPDDWKLLDISMVVGLCVMCDLLREVFGIAVSQSISKNNQRENAFDSPTIFDGEKIL